MIVVNIAQRPRSQDVLQDVLFYQRDSSHDVPDARDCAVARDQNNDQQHDSRVVELRFFTGLSEQETAEAMNISISTLKRDWHFAKAWLFDQLRLP